MTQTTKTNIILLQCVELNLIFKKSVHFQNLQNSQIHCIFKMCKCVKFIVFSKFVKFAKFDFYKTLCIATLGHCLCSMHPLNVTERHVTPQLISNLDDSRSNVSRRRIPGQLLNQRRHKRLDVVGRKQTPKVCTDVADSFDGDTTDNVTSVVQQHLSRKRTGDKKIEYQIKTLNVPY